MKAIKGFSDCWPPARHAARFPSRFHLSWAQRALLRPRSAGRSSRSESSPSRCSLCWSPHLGGEAARLIPARFRPGVRREPPSRPARVARLSRARRVNQIGSSASRSRQTGAGLQRARLRRARKAAFGFCGQAGGAGMDKSILPIRARPISKRRHAGVAENGGSARRGLAYRPFNTSVASRLPASGKGRSFQPRARSRPCRVADGHGGNTRQSLRCCRHAAYFHRRCGRQARLRGSYWRPVDDEGLGSASFTQLYPRSPSRSGSGPKSRDTDQPAIRMHGRIPRVRAPATLSPHSSL